MLKKLSKCYFQLKNMSSMHVTFIIQDRKHGNRINNVLETQSDSMHHNTVIKLGELLNKLQALNRHC